jgi:hypothetical protein
MTRLHHALLVAVALLGFAPARVHGQIDVVMAAMRNGGGWVSIDIQAGRGVARTLPMPAMGMTINGCMEVWEGNTGRWRIRAHDTVLDKTVESSSLPGEDVLFTHEFGLRTQLDVEVIWSEPRDTTLYLWVGLGDAESDPDVCTPKGPGPNGVG